MPDQADNRTDTIPSRNEIVEFIQDKYDHWYEQGMVDSPEQFQEDYSNPTYGFDQNQGPTNNPQQMLYARDLLSIRHLLQNARAQQILQQDMQEQETAEEESTEEELEGGDLAEPENVAPRPADQFQNGINRLLSGFFSFWDTSFTDALDTRSIVLVRSPIRPTKLQQDVAVRILAPLMRMAGLTEVSLRPLDPTGEPIDDEDVEAKLEWVRDACKSFRPLISYLSDQHSEDPT